MSTATAPAVKKLPKRSEVRPEDCWDLSSLFADLAAKVGGKNGHKG